MTRNNKLIIDAFPVFNELDLFRFRISYLGSLVDRFVIAESNLTHSGVPKPLFVTTWLAQFDQETREKFHVLQVPLEDLKSSWEREIFTREYLAKYLTKTFSSARFILSDLDEIPSQKQVQTLKNKKGIFHFVTITSYRKSNWTLVDSHSNWHLGVMGEVSELEGLPNGGRFSKLSIIDADFGAHLSYFGCDSQTLSKKFQATAHTELNENFRSDPNLLNFSDHYRVDHLGRGRSPGFGVFQVVGLGENAVIDEIRKHHPQHFDKGNDLPSKKSRILASIWLTSYVGNGPISKFKRYIFPPYFYFSSLLIMILFPPMVEITITFILQMRRRLFL